MCTGKVCQPRGGREREGGRDLRWRRIPGAEKNLRTWEKKQTSFVCLFVCRTPVKQLSLISIYFSIKSKCCCWNRQEKYKKKLRISLCFALRNKLQLSASFESNWEYSFSLSSPGQYSCLVSNFCFFSVFVFETKIQFCLGTRLGTTKTRIFFSKSRRNKNKNSQRKVVEAKVWPFFCCLEQFWKIKYLNSFSHIFCLSLF